MSFMGEVVSHSKGIWVECLNTPFVQELKTGKLPREKFKQYMIQDSIYLKHYARVFGKAIYHSGALKDIQTYYSVLSFVNDSESAVRLDYLKQFDITDDDIELIAPLPENKNYIDFMLEAAERGNVCEILMTVLPCMLSYGYIARELASEPITKDSQYWDFIQDYANDDCYEACKQLEDFADSKCKNLSDAEKDELKSIFRKASLLELDFWKMAYQE